MGLSRYRIGELIKQTDFRNGELSYSLEDVKGISIQKIFITTKADMQDVSLNSYKLVKPDNFAYVTVTSRNGEKITLAHNTTESTFIVSSSYITFRVAKVDLLLPDFLFMFFNRPEFDRYSRFNSWGSARETFSWEDLCDIEIDLPSLAIQQKYVDVYSAMKANQESYERGLDDLKLVCDAFIENLRRQMPCEKIGKYIEEVNETNSDSKFTHVQGVESGGAFMDTRANMQGVDITKYTVVRKNNIAYNPSRINIGSIAIYTEEIPCIVSPMYTVFRVTNIKKILPEYLMLWFDRAEFQRHTLYHASGSVRDTFDFNLMQDVEIPIPSLEIQKNIVNIYKTYQERKALSEKLKAQIKDVCPILIKGSIEEGRREA